MKASVQTDLDRFDTFLTKFADTMGIPKRKLERYIFQTLDWRKDWMHSDSHRGRGGLSKKRLNVAAK
jgi:hypothetical protein